MSRTLVVCDNEFLSVLYVINLEVYLATSVELVTSAEAAIAVHKKKKNFDLIISLDTINKQDAFTEINEYRGSYGVKTPLIKVGADNDLDIDAKTFAVSSRYNIQSLLKKSASILNVTAKKMAELQMGDYYPISIAPIEGLSKAPCNLYYDVGAQKKILARTDDAIEESLKNIKSQGVEKIFVKSSDRLVIVNNVSIKIIEKITLALKNSAGDTTEKKIEVLNDGYEFAMANLFTSDEVKQEMAEIASASSKVMTEVIKDNNQLKALISTLMSNKSGYVFIHSMITSYVASHIIKNATWGGDGQLDKINFVLFFHDIYLAPLYLKYPDLKYEKTLLNSPLLNEKERDIVMNHARLAAELVVAYKRCPMGADILIKQHHGMKKGSGFATKYPEDLSPLSKVLLVAEAFVEIFMEMGEKKQKVEMKLIIPKMIEGFETPSYIKILQTLVNLPL
jgi:response regulator RpfG family c-di-GMP phosphodiesterase